MPKGAPLLITTTLCAPLTAVSVLVRRLYVSSILVGARLTTFATIGRRRRDSDVSAADRVTRPGNPGGASRFGARWPASRKLPPSGRNWRRAGLGTNNCSAIDSIRSFWGAWRTPAGYEAIHMIGKGQASGGSAGGDAVPLHAFIRSMFGFEG